MAPRQDGVCTACGCPVDGTAPAHRRAVDLGPPDAAGGAAREEIRRLLLGAGLVAGGCAALGVSWVVLAGGSGLWKAVVVVAMAMLFRGVWEWWEVDRRLAGAMVVCVGTVCVGWLAWRSAVADRESWQIVTADEVASLRRRGRIFLFIAAAVAVYAAHRIRTVVLRRRRERVPAARVHSDERG